MKKAVPSSEAMVDDFHHSPSKNSPSSDGTLAREGHVRKRKERGQENGTVGQGSSRATDAEKEGGTRGDAQPAARATPGVGRGGFDRRDVNAGIALLKRRLVGPDWIAGLEDGAMATLLPEVDENRRKLEELLANTVVNAYNNSALLLGPRGCGKTMVVERVLHSLTEKHADLVAHVRLNGLLHADDRSALKEIARQLCSENQLAFSKASSFDDNLRFLKAMLKECEKSHKAVIFILDEFDLFAQAPKQCLLYNLLDAMQSSEAQAAVVGVTCRLDADQLLEKRVRSRFSHRKLLFLPPRADDVKLLVQGVLTLPDNAGDGGGGGAAFARLFNAKLQKLMGQQNMTELLETYTGVSCSFTHIFDLLFKALSTMDRERAHLTYADFQRAKGCLWKEPTALALLDASVLELHLLVAMKRLEGQASSSSSSASSFNFHTLFKEYEGRQASHTLDGNDAYSRQVALRAFEHLVEKELLAFADNRGGQQTAQLEYRAVLLTVSHAELKRALLAHPMCPVGLKQWFEHEGPRRAVRADL